MLRVVYKYEIPHIGEVFELKLPTRHFICDVNHQDNKLFLWALINPDAATVPLKFMVIGTGWVIQDSASMLFIKTVHMPNGLVWHLFQVDDTDSSGPLIKD